MNRILRERDRLADWLGLFLFSVAMNLMTPTRRIVTSACLAQFCREAYGDEALSMATRACEGPVK